MVTVAVAIAVTIAIAVTGVGGGSAKDEGQKDGGGEKDLLEHRGNLQLVTPQRLIGPAS